MGVYTLGWEIVSHKLIQRALGGPGLAFLLMYALMTLDRLQTAVPSHRQAGLIPKPGRWAQPGVPVLIIRNLYIGRA